MQTSRVVGPNRRSVSPLSESGFEKVVISNDGITPWATADLDRLHSAEQSLPLRDLRQQAGYTAAEVAAQVGVHPMSVTRWERGERLPGPVQLRALAAALGVDRVIVTSIFDRVRHALPATVSDRVRAPGLRQARLRYRTPVRTIAELLHVPVSTVYNWEAARVGVPRRHLPTLARAWGCDVKTLHAALREPSAKSPRPALPLRRLRLRNGMTQAEVAVRLQVSRYSVARWEAGHRPPLHALRALALLYRESTSSVAAAAGVTAPPLLNCRSWRRGDLPEVLRLLRAWSGLTQAQVARHCGCSVDAVRGWERGRAVPFPARRAALEVLYRLRCGSLLTCYPHAS